MYIGQVVTIIGNGHETHEILDITRDNDGLLWAMLNTGSRIERYCEAELKPLCQNPALMSLEQLISDMIA